MKKVGLVVCLLFFVSACGGTSETVEVAKTVAPTTTLAPSTTVTSTTTVVPTTTIFEPSIPDISYFSDIDPATFKALQLHALLEDVQGLNEIRLETLQRLFEEANPWTTVMTAFYAIDRMLKSERL